MRRATIKSLLTAAIEQIEAIEGQAVYAVYAVSLLKLHTSV